MKYTRLLLLISFAVLFALAACSEPTPAADSPLPPPTNQSAALPSVIAAPGVPVTPVTVEPNTTPNATAVVPANTPVPVPVAKESYCKNGGALVVDANAPLAAKVNGQPIPLALYQKAAAQDQAAAEAQGFDPKAADAAEQIKGIQQQALGRLIDNLLVEQAAQKAGVAVNAQEVDGRVQQLIDEAGSRDKFDQWLASQQISLDDMCMQLRYSILGEAILDKVTAGMPTKVEQVHAAQILLATQADADKVVAQLKAGQKFADLAKQYSVDETTRDKGGDLGWLPRGIMPPEFEAVAFKLQPGQTSGVVSTALGFHIIQVIAHESARELDPQLLQNQKQQAFLEWLDGQRNQAKIEKLVNP